MADRSFIGSGDPCGSICRSAQTFRELTSGSLIVSRDKLLRDVDEAIVELASGDGQTSAKEKTKDYEKALKLMEKYLSDLDTLRDKGEARPTVFNDLNAGAEALIDMIEAALGS